MPNHTKIYGSAWIVSLSLLTLTLLAAGCAPATPVSGDALCDGTRQALDDHAAALADTPDDRVAVTGARLVAMIDAGCGD